MSGSRLRWPFSKKKTISIPCANLQDPEPPSPCLTPPSPLATANSPFFQRFPAEIRDQILIEAFGKNAIHIHAELEYTEEHFRPPSPPPRKSRSRLCNCVCSSSEPPQKNVQKVTKKDEAHWKELIYHDTININMPFGISRAPEALAANPTFCPHHIIQPKERWRIVPGSEDTGGMPSGGIIQTTTITTTKQSNGNVHGQSRPTRWRFSTSICHRLMDFFHRPPFDDQSSFSGRLSPWDDVCLYDGFCPDLNNSSPRSHIQRKCLIGVMGFLLSCKQAYFEASNVLYGRNLFHVSGDLMFRRLPYILPRERLESIATVELVWDLYPEKMDFVYCEKHRRMRQVTAFEERLRGLGAIMDELARRMPGLRNVWLCLQSNIVEDSIEKEERLDGVERVLAVIDKGILRLPKLENARVAFSDSFFGKYGALCTTEMPERCISRRTGYAERWWRDLSGRDAKWEESRDWTANTVSWASLGKGYWIMPGKPEVGGYYQSNCGI